VAALLVLVETLVSTMFACRSPRRQICAQRQHTDRHGLDRRRTSRTVRHRCCDRPWRTIRLLHKSQPGQPQLSAAWRWRASRGSVICTEYPQHGVHGGVLLAAGGQHAERMSQLRKSSHIPRHPSLRSRAKGAHRSLRRRWADRTLDSSYGWQAMRRLSAVARSAKADAPSILLRSRVHLARDFSGMGSLTGRDPPCCDVSATSPLRASLRLSPRRKSNKGDVVPPHLSFAM
jgi:hypothetical protein